MTFRDDHDAALARADALEDEVERTKRERDALAAKVKELEAEKAKPPQKPKAEKKKKAPKPEKSKRAESSSDRAERRAGIIGGLIAVVIVGGAMIYGALQGAEHDRALDDWDARSRARTEYRARWQALVGVEACVRHIAYDAVMVRRNTPDKADPRKAHVWSFADRLGGNCMHGTDKLIADPKTSPAMRTALSAWLNIQRELGTAAKPLHAYYSNGDWKEDNFRGAPALWAPVLALLERQIGVIAVVRRDVFPAIRDEIRSMKRAHEARGREVIWWRVELGLRFWDINDRAYAAAGIYAGREPDDTAGAAAVRDGVVALLEVSKQAPIEVRRIVRKLDWVTGQIVSGGPLRGETPLWHMASDGDRDLIGIAQHDVVPALPPDPGPRPPNRD